MDMRMALSYRCLLSSVPRFCQGVDSLQHAGDVGIWVVSVAAHALVGDIRRHIAERGVVVLDIIEYGHAITQFQLLHL